MKRIIDLSGEWLYKIETEKTVEELCFFDPSLDTSSWQKMKIPSNWEVYGLHDYSGVVWFRNKFEISSSNLKNKQVFLKFHGVDYFADVWLNGNYLGSHEGYFQPFEFDVSDTIIEGKNVLVVKVNSPKEGKNWPLRKRLIKGVFGHHDLRPGSWSREFGQSMGTGGIWNKVQLIIANNICIKDIKVSSKLKENYRKAEIEVSVNIESKKEVNAKIEAKVMENKKLPAISSLQKKAHLKTGRNIFNLKFTIKNPKLWWCWDHGDPNLYKLEVSIKKDRKVIDRDFIRFGIRELKIDKNMNWYLNGKKIFIRGSNIIPEEYLSTYTRERIKKDIKLVKEANINALRVHAHINRKEFYEACDKAGILVWQDFALQWEYEQSKKFYNNAKKQIKDMVNLLYNHPSIVLWCCHNEPTLSRKTLDPLLYKEVKKLDKTRPIFKSSNFAEHPYPGWFSGKMEYFSSLPGAPLVTEFGAQALPGLKTLKKFFKNSELWPPKWKVWAFRNFTYEQYFNIACQKTGNSIKEFIKISQSYQANLIKFAIETYRRNRSKVSGLFHFMLCDPWPCISYSVLDYFRVKKEGFYSLKKAYQPILIIYVPEREVFSIGDGLKGTFFIVSDLEKRFEKAKIELTLKGKERNLRFPKITTTIEPNSCKEITNDVYSFANSLRIPENFNDGEYKLILNVYNKNGVLLCSNDYKIKLKRVPKGIKNFSAVFEWE